MGNILKPNTFSQNTTISSSQVNDNFDTIYNEFNGGISAANLATGAVTTAKIADSNVTTAKLADDAVTSAKLSDDVAAGWLALGSTPNTVTYNGNRSYSMVFNSTDLTGVISPGMRLRTTRTVSAPTQCTSLNGTNQYYSKTSPAGMTFTDDFVVSAWIKASSYAAGSIVSRFNGTSGWELKMNSSGQIFLAGYNAGATNYKGVQSYQSVPLNKWIHISAQVDMNTATLTSTTNYVMFDGVDVPASIIQGGTNPTVLIQAGNLEIGSSNALGFFPGKIAQVAIFNAKVTQATMQGYISQGLAGTETSLISAYSFNGVITDLNTTNANNLTANGSAVATNADSPFGTQASGLISSTLDYAIIQSAAFSTNTTVVVQVPEGCTIPTSGGVTTISYSSLKAPYGFPAEVGRWQVETLILTSISTTISVSGTWVSTLQKLSVPTGKWNVAMEGTIQSSTTVAAVRSTFFALSSVVPTNSQYIQPISGRLLISLNSSNIASTVYKKYPVSTSTATDYTIYATSDSLSGTETAVIRGDQGQFNIIAENGYL